MMRKLSCVFQWPLRDLIPYTVARGVQRSREFVDSLITAVLACWWNFHLKGGLRACGIPILRKHPTASVHVGSRVTLRSSEWSNTVGLNRRCLINASRDAAIFIGDDCGFSGTIISAAESITIGNRVLCGANCTIVDTDRHATDATARAMGLPGGTAAVVIEDDVWLGMNVVVLKGCRIGRNSVVAANSVVTRSLPAGVLAGGVPARVIRNLEQET